MRKNGRHPLCSDLATRRRPDAGRVLVTGATGYVGSQLVPELVARGYPVRVMVRSASQACEERWPDAEVAVADALDRAALERACQGVDTVYYLIHSLLLGREAFEAAELQAARSVRQAAARQGVRRIIYLGGLGDSAAPLSPHLRSRRRVARELAQGPVPVTVLRAAVIIGSGSASYEILSHLIRHTPVVPVPKWARTRCQPISIRDVIRNLVGVLEVEETAGKTFDIGGPDVLTYEEMLRALARRLGKRRVFLPSPLSHVPTNAYLVARLTSVPHAICLALMRSIKDPAVCQNREIEEYLQYSRLTFGEAIDDALAHEDGGGQPSREPAGAGRRALRPIPEGEAAKRAGDRRRS